MQNNLQTNMSTNMTNQSNPPLAAFDMLMTTLNILNQRFDNFQQQTSQQLSKLHALDTINQRLTSLEGGLSDIKHDIQSMKNKIHEVDKTLQNEEQHHNDIERRMGEVDEDRVYLLRENERLREDLLKLQTHSMKYNLIFEGLSETESENTETVIKEFIKTELKIEDEISFQNVHRLRKTKDHTPRAILARFTRYSDHDLVIKAVPENLRGKNYYNVYQQYPREIADLRKELYPKLREHRRQERRTNIVVDQLYVDGVWYPNGDPLKTNQLYIDQ
jgi:chromosome segregation ATPase